MARAIPTEMNNSKPLTPSIGRQMLEIVTAGMYSDPRMIYREFVQNSADSIDSAYESGLLKQGDGQIQIWIGGERRIVTVEDNGTGIPLDQVEDRLGSMGSSAKEGTLQRGFRGIGRLGGLAHCDLLRFETRSKGESEVAVVEWDGKALRETIKVGAKRESLLEVVRRIAKVSYREGRKNDGPHFFRVTMENVHRFHADLLMNVEAVRGYLAQEAPVPFDQNLFSFAGQLNGYLSAVPGFRTYAITVNDQIILRPYTDEFEINESSADRISGVETFEFTTSDGAILARGWFAKTSLLASLPRRCAMRGVRVRQGNISIGSEYLLEDVFTERRFVTWHVGSIEVGQQLRPNARRDGFEETPSYERFLEQAALLGRHLSKLCRKQSKIRVEKVSAHKKLMSIETAMMMEFFVDARHRDTTILEFRKNLIALEASGGKVISDETFGSRLKLLRQRLEKLQGEAPLLVKRLDGRKLQRLNGQALLERICNVIIDCGVGGDKNHLIMRQVVGPFLKSGS